MQKKIRFVSPDQTFSIRSERRLVVLAVIISFVVSFFIVGAPASVSKSSSARTGAPRQGQAAGQLPKVPPPIETSPRPDKDYSPGPAAPTADPFFQGFEIDNSGWNIFGGQFDATRVASGTNGVTSRTGSFHGEAGQFDGSAATNWGGYTTTFPAQGYSTEVDVYLNMAGGAANDTRFDFSSAINDNLGSFHRDFVFNGGFYDNSDFTGTGPRFVISASNNAGRGNAFPKNPFRDPFTLISSGWYKLRHRFFNNNGVLAVSMTIADSTGAVVHTWLLSDPADVIGGIGGNRYGFFANNEFSFLAIDNSFKNSCASNVALASSGATATASSTVNGNFPAAGAIDGEHDGNNWGSGGGWNDGTRNVYPDSVIVNFNVEQTIDTINIYTLKNDFNSGSTVNDTSTFTSYGITNFTVQYFNGASFVDVPGGAVVGNNKVKRTFLFPAITTDRIRVLVDDSADHIYSRVVEIEAFGCEPNAVPTPSPTPTPEPTPCTEPGNNVASATAGSAAVASSSVNANFPAAGAIDGEHNGNSWGSGGGWNDGTRGVFPDNIQVNFAATQTIREIDVYTLKNNFNSGSTVTDATTFTSYGITNFNVQYWTGTIWIDVPGGAVVGNNLVKRKFIFPDITTDKIRVVVNDSADHLYSRVIEIEAFACTP